MITVPRECKASNDDFVESINPELLCFDKDGFAHGSRYSILFGDDIRMTFKCFLDEEEEGKSFAMFSMTIANMNLIDLLIFRDDRYSGSKFDLKSM